MSQDYTQQQSADDEQRSRQLSLKHARPPVEIPGYKLERFLGSGAYGEVWVALDRNTGRRVAVKFFAHRSGVDWPLLSREVEKLVFLSADRYVVQLLEVGWDSEPPFYVMEYVESGSLENLISEQGPLPVAEAVEMFREICVGLSHAHGKGVLHCDLKPANILLDQDHRPRLADFGQSRLSSEQTPALGTLFYMAPEQADLAAVPDVRWDVYALGAILHCMLVGEPPHRSQQTSSELETVADLPDRLARYRKAIRTAPPALAHRRVSGVDRSLAEIIERCLATRPEDRFANVQEIVTALAQRQRARQRRPVIAFGFIFPVLVLLVMAFFGWRGYQRALRDTEALATERALENNDFAARLAAQQVSNEIAQYFEIAEDEASRDPLLENFENVRNHELLGKMKLLSQTADETQRQQWRQEFFADEKRAKFDEYLQRRLASHRRQENPRIASVFVLDAEGTQVAAAFEDNETPKSIGNNLAYRSYFHGGSKDEPKGTHVNDKIKPVRKTHLSAVFQSTTTGKWKVAIASPIWKELPNDNYELIGLFVLTVNLGDFEFFKQVQQSPNERFAALVDGRKGDMGVILQHPLFDEITRSGNPLPEEFRNRRVPLDAQGELPDAIQRQYFDPLASDDLAAWYAGPWIASAVPVYLNHDPESKSGLVVLVQESYQAVTGPVRELGTRLVREGVLAIAVVILVTGLLWYAVLRLIREPRSVPRLRPMPLESTRMHGEPTLVAGQTSAP